MKKLILMSVLVLGALTGHAQRSQMVATPKRNTVYVEALGQGLYNSLSFDRLYRTDKIVKNSLTAGITLIPLKNTPDHLFVFGVPVSFNWLFGKKDHHLELGAGLTGLYTEEQYQYADNSTGTYPQFHVYMTPKVSYRYQRVNGGLFLRVSFTPLIALVEKDGFGGESYFPEAYTPFGYRAFPWPGVSLGWTLKCGNRE